MEIKPNTSQLTYSRTKAKTDSASALVGQGEKPSMSVHQITKKLMNGQILAAQEKVSINAKEQSMALLYRHAIDAIDTELDAVLGENIQPEKKPVMGTWDFSPAETAQRIVNVATAYFGLYQQQSSDKDVTTQLTTFVDKVSSAIDSGFKQANSSFKGLKALDDSLASGIEQTYELIQQGLAKFKQDMLPSNEAN